MRLNALVNCFFFAVWSFSSPSFQGWNLQADRGSSPTGCHWVWGAQATGMKHTQTFFFFFFSVHLVFRVGRRGMNACACMTHAPSVGTLAAKRAPCEKGSEVCPKAGTAHPHPGLCWKPHHDVYDSDDCPRFGLRPQGNKKFPPPPSPQVRPTEASRPSIIGLHRPFPLRR